MIIKGGNSGKNELLKIKQGDYVKHNPSGEEWIVCGINYESNRLIPCGYPFPSMAKISDCELTQINKLTEKQKQEYNEALEKSGMISYMSI